MLSLEELLQGSRSIAIVHGGDADGLASAAMLMSRIPQGASVHLVYAEQGFGEEVLEGLRSASPELTVFIGLGLGVAEARRVSEGLGCRVVVLDTHPGGPVGVYGGALFVNPTTGLGVQYPSVTWLLHDMGVGRELLLPVAVGALRGAVLGGGSWIFEEVAEYSRAMALGLGELINLSRAVDACGKVGDRGCVASTPARLLELSGSPRSSLEEGMWFRALSELSREISGLLRTAEPEERQGYRVYLFKGRFSSSLDLLESLGAGEGVVVAVHRGRVLEAAAITGTVTHTLCEEARRRGLRCRPVLSRAVLWVRGPLHRGISRVLGILDRFGNRTPRL